MTGRGKTTYKINLKIPQSYPNLLDNMGGRIETGGYFSSKKNSK